MPGYINSLIISLALHALVVIPIASLVFTAGSHPPGSRPSLNLVVVRASADDRHPPVQGSADPSETPRPAPPVAHEQASSMAQAALPAPVEEQATPQKKESERPQEGMAVQTAQPKPPIPEPMKSLPGPAPQHLAQQVAAASQPVQRPLNNPTLETRPDPAEDAQTDLLAEYRNRLLSAITAAQRYPSRARRRGLEGETTLAFSVLRDGRIVDIHILGESGHRVLDQAAVETLQRVGQLGPIPYAFAGERWDLQIPIRFQLL